MAPECPECTAFIKLPADTIKGEIVKCPDCAAELEVTATEGGKFEDGELKIAPLEKEDWGE
jgi:alpha-aminoadipate carrier protein LysW